MHVYIDDIQKYNVFNKKLQRWFEIELIFREQSSGSQLIREAGSLEGHLTAQPASSVLSEGGNETGLASMTVYVRDMLGMVLILWSLLEIKPSFILPKSHIIMLALILNYISNNIFKKTYQLVSYWKLKKYILK